MTAIATLPVLAQQGTHAARPAASAVGSGALYACTTHGLIYQMLAGSWGTWFTPGGFANPMTTAEDIIYGGASGVPTRKAKGSDGTFLGVAAGALTYQAVTDALLSTSDITTNDASTSKHGFVPKLPNDATKYYDGTGAFTVPAGGGGGGGLVLLEQHTASSSATLDFTSFISGTYDDYLFRIVNLVPASNNVSLQMRVGTGGGPTWDTSGNYSYGMLYSGIGDSPTQSSGTGQTAIDLAHSISTTANCHTNGQINLMNPGGSAFKFIEGKLQSVAAGSLYQWANSGSWGGTSALTGVRFFFSSGNIASGTIRVYGLAK
jgi:hypothetical protein